MRPSIVTWVRLFWSTLLAFAIALTIAPAARAEPTLPPGWIAGGPARPMSAEPAPSRRSRQALQLAGSPLRPAIAPVSLALGAFDVVDLAPAPSEKEIRSSNADPGGEAPDDLFIDRGCWRASVKGHAVGIMSVGWISRPIGPQSSLGPSLWHVRGSGGGDGRHVFARARWETLDRLPDGALRYTETVARFNVLTCKARVARRFTVVARPILSGLAFVFRTRCAACEPRARDELHVILPSNGWGTDEYDHRVLPIGGDGGSARPRVSRFNADKFGRMVRRPLPLPAIDMDLLIGVEVARALGEAEPTVIAYAAETRHVGF